jgi:uncharacterized repeat protein (TIGR03847 family)
MNFDIANVDSFTAGTVGPKGQRTFFLQAIAGENLFSLKLEKQQVLAMAEHLANLLEDLPEIEAQEWTSAPELVEPVEPLWVVGAMGAMYDASADAVVLMAEEVTEDPEVDTAATATFRLRRSQTLAFIERAHEIVEAGRPPCQWCSRPLNFGEDGFCPCWN